MEKILVHEFGDRGRHEDDSPLPVRNSDENKIYRAGGWRKLNGSQVGPAEKNSLFPDDIPIKSNLNSRALDLRPGTTPQFKVGRDRGWGGSVFWTLFESSGPSAHQ
ncbi:hypothetical protein CEXT_58561 [Caerostris extrusa]|uniref:Uncharacterized protein n=1 Tax=Caerostris extrusa TaxID=172846 RepID=A0AAV4U080_CAEEX|nr:hypothetical protein CEXT_58561 [Caerostris extrusa]